MEGVPTPRGRFVAAAATLRPSVRAAVSALWYAVGDDDGPARAPGDDAPGDSHRARAAAAAAAASAIDEVSPIASTGRPSEGR